MTSPSVNKANRRTEMDDLQALDAAHDELETATLAHLRASIRYEEVRYDDKGARAEAMAACQVAAERRTRAQLAVERMKDRCMVRLVAQRQEDLDRHQRDPELLDAAIDYYLSNTRT